MGGKLHSLLNDLKQGHAQSNSLSAASVLDLLEALVHHAVPVTEKADPDGQDEADETDHANAEDSNPESDDGKGTVSTDAVQGDGETGRLGPETSNGNAVQSGEKAADASVPVSADEIERGQASEGKN